MNITYRGVSYLLERDAHCFSLSKQGINKKTGKETNTVIGYYNNLPSVVEALFNNHVLDESNTKTLLECIKNTKQELKALCEGVI